MQWVTGVLGRGQGCFFTSSAWRWALYREGFGLIPASPAQTSTRMRAQKSTNKLTIARTHPPPPVLHHLWPVARVHHAQSAAGAGARACVLIVGGFVCVWLGGGKLVPSARRARAPRSPGCPRSLKNPPPPPSPPPQTMGSNANFMFNLVNGFIQPYPMIPVRRPL